VVAHFPANHDSYARNKMITLHAHSDMVGAKASGSNHNFLRDPISLKTNGE
jgi:di/tripeptidase